MRQSRRGGTAAERDQGLRGNRDRAQGRFLAGPTRQANKARQRMACQDRAIPKLMFDRRVATLAVPKGHARPVLRNSIVAGAVPSYGQSKQVAWRCPPPTYPQWNKRKGIAPNAAPPAARALNSRG